MRGLHMWIWAAVFGVAAYGMYHANFERRHYQVGAQAFPDCGETEVVMQDSLRTWCGVPPLRDPDSESAPTTPAYRLPAANPSMQINTPGIATITSDLHGALAAPESQAAQVVADAALSRTEWLWIILWCAVISPTISILGVFLFVALMRRDWRD